MDRTVVRDSHWQLLARRATPLFSGRQSRAVRQQRLVVEARIVGHSHVEAEAECEPTKQRLPISTRPRIR